jgi:hypothetical protein
LPPPTEEIASDPVLLDLDEVLRKLPATVRKSVLNLVRKMGGVGG